MAENMHYLTDADVKILKSLVAQVKGTVRRVRPEDEQPIRGNSPDVYIALPPVDGIPALTRAQTVVGTGSGSSDVPSEYDRPGVAPCTIAMITQVDSPLPQLVLLNESAQQYVYNLSSTSIGQDWIQIHRDKFGRWLAVQGGGGCESQNCKMMFTIFGRPTGGNFTFPLTIRGVTEPLTASFSQTETQFRNIIQTHSQVGVGNVTISGLTGPFPNATIEIEFVGNLANTDIILPTSDWTNLTGGIGMAVLIYYSQKGHG